MASPNYFTCTLGEAQSLGLTDPNFKNISHFIDDQALKVPSRPAVGFAVPPALGCTPTEWTAHTYSYETLASHSTSYSMRLRASHEGQLKSSKTVALLAPSTLDFLLAWLALMRLGHAVLLIAPQCQPAAIAHLCDSCEVSTLFYDEQYADLAKQALQLVSDKGKQLATIMLQTHDVISSQAATIKVGSQSFCSPPPVATDVAYLHHTSGTSSGLPKPIPQSHRAGAGVLPAFPDGHKAATFTTTPLYHGGVADCFRAWKSGAMIWLFPGKGVPITANNVVSCLDIAASLSDEGQIPPVRYFSSVPYILQSMEASSDGLKHLKRMSIVGVGGAALPAEVGDRLIAAGVPLISRFGSAECGFLMSSHRDYTNDKEWQYLRAPSLSNLKFEADTSSPDLDLHELVIPKGWPHMAKRNREDGSFATADLFAPHPTISGAWKYHSRADSQLTLLTGKKFDPAPLEDAIATSELLSDVLIFGNGKPYPGALLFRSREATDVTDAELVERLWLQVDKLNGQSQDHARLLRKMLVAMPALEQPLEKSSKGTVIRRAAEERFASSIEDAYTGTTDESLAQVDDSRIGQVLKQRIRAATNGKREPEDSDDLFAYGVDSVAGMMVRNDVRQLVGTAVQVPLNVVEDCGTLGRLVEYVIQTRKGLSFFVDGHDDEKGLMLELAKRYSRFDDDDDDDDDGPRSSLTGSSNGTARDKDKHVHVGDGEEVIVLTGVTGALGAHLLDSYMHDPKTRRVYCLVRGATDHACRERVVKALQTRKLRDLVDDKVIVLRAQLGEDGLGLSDEDYGRVAGEATTILHVAWAVNFRMRLRAFEKDHIGGLHNLIRLALCSPSSPPPQIGFCSSVASVLAYGSPPIPEQIISDHAAATTLGYSRSKWVAEQVCDAANKSTPLRGRVTVFRVGQLGGDSERGVWNASEAWPLMLSVGVKTLKAMPDLTELGERLDWLPVDVASRAIKEGMDQGRQRLLSTSTNISSESGGGGRSGAEAMIDDAGDSDDPQDTATTAIIADEGTINAIPGVGSSVASSGLDVGWLAAGDGLVGANCLPTTSVMHVVHDGPNPIWRLLLEWLQQERSRATEAPFEVLDPAEWVGRLERASDGVAIQEDEATSPSKNEVEQGDPVGGRMNNPHPAFKLLELWKAAYGQDRMGGSSEQGLEEDGRGFKFAMQKTKAAIPALRHLRPIDKDYVVRVWRWIDENM